MGSRANSDFKLCHLPEELVIEILLTLPVKSLLGLKTVSKSCYSLKTNLITNPTFIQAHLKNSSRTNSFILTKKQGFSIHHDNISLLQYSVPELPSHYDNTCLLTYSVPKLPSRFFESLLKIHGSSNGLICYSNGHNIHLWNPALRKLKILPKSHIAFDSYNYKTMSIAFGFHPGVNDYKVVRILSRSRFMDEYETEVYSLRRDCWRRSIEDGPVFYFDYAQRQATVNGAAYWLGNKKIEGGDYCSVVLRFEMGHEVFGEVSLPEHGPRNFSGITILGESVLCLFKQYEVGGYEIWTMEDRGNWTKRYTMNGKVPRKLLGFRKSGELLLLRRQWNGDEDIVESYNFEEKMFKLLGICGRFDKVYSYVESLVQLDGADIN